MIGDILWTPPRDLRQSTEIGRYMNWLREERGRELDTYDELWRWSVEDLEGFGGRSGISTASAPMPRTTRPRFPWDAGGGVVSRGAAQLCRASGGDR